MRYVLMFLLAFATMAVPPAQAEERKRVEGSTHSVGKWVKRKPSGPLRRSLSARPPMRIAGPPTTNCTGTKDLTPRQHSELVRKLLIGTITACERKQLRLNQIEQDLMCVKEWRDNTSELRAVKGRPAKEIVVSLIVALDRCLKFKVPQ